MTLPAQLIEISNNRLIRLSEIAVLTRAYARVGREKLDLREGDYEKIKDVFVRATYLQPPEGGTDTPGLVTKGIGIDGGSGGNDNPQL